METINRDFLELSEAEQLMYKMYNMLPAEASSFAKKHGYHVRLVQLDDTTFVGTCDLDFSRINMTIKDGKVTHLNIG